MLMTAKKNYRIYSVLESAKVVPDYRKYCFDLSFEDGLHGTVKRVRNNSTVTVEEHLDECEPSHIALVDEREDLKIISSMADLKYDPYMYAPFMEYLIGRGGIWDWEAKESKLIEATNDDEVDLRMIRVSPLIGMPSREEFAKWCLDYVWEDDMTKSQAIVYYYHNDRGMSFGNIAKIMGKAPQNVNSTYRAAEEKRESSSERVWNRKEYKEAMKGMDGVRSNKGKPSE